MTKSRMRKPGGLRTALIGLSFSLMLAGCGGDEQDTTAPAVRFSFPAEYTILSGVETIRVLASDNDKITQVKFALDGQTLEVQTAAPYTLLLNTTAFPDCTTVASTVSLTAVAEDPAGNKGVAERLYYLDNEGLPPLGVEMLPAQGITKHSATLTWRPSVDFDFSHYTLYRDTSETVTQASDSLTLIADRTVTSFTDSGPGVTPFGLDESSDYNYRVYVHDDYGRSTGSDSVARVHTLLPQPVILTSNADPTKYTVLLSWTASTEDVAYYRLHRGLTELQTDLDSIAGIAPSVTAYIDTGLTANSNYFYYLYNVDSAAYIDTFLIGNVLPIKTDSLDAPILVPSAQGVSKYSATLQWLRVPVQEDSSWIGLYRSTTGSVDSNSARVTFQNVANSGIIYADKGLAQGQDYQFAMRHHDSRNNIEWSDVVELTTLSISDVWSGGLGVSDQQKYTLGLTWDAYSYLPDDFASYVLYRDGAQVFSSSSSNEDNTIDTGLQRKTTYSYTLTVTDTSGAQASATTQATTRDILPAEITLVEPTVLWFYQLAWLPSAEPASEFDRYALVRSNDENETFDDGDSDNEPDCVTAGDCALVAVLPNQEPSAGDTVITYEDNDTNLISGDLNALPIYRYAVLTYDIVGGYSVSNIVGDTLYAPPAAVTLSYDASVGATTTTIPLVWTKADWRYPVLNTLLFARYEVWRNTKQGESPGDAGTTYQRIVSFDNINLTTHVDAEISGQFAYRIVLVDKVGRSAISNEIFPATTPPLMRRLVLIALLMAACQTPELPIQSVRLWAGSYVRIENRQVVGEVRDSTSLGFFSDDQFSVEVRAAGDTLPASVSELPTLFMIADEQGGAEVGIFRASLQDDRIFVTMGNQYVQNSSGEISLEVPGCDWNDPDVFTLIVLTYDGTTVKVFGNGALLASSAINFDIDVADTDALIGANWGAPNDASDVSNFWYGTIDEVRLWRIVIPTSEMQFRYQNPDKLTKRYSDTGLVPLMGLWRFNVELDAGDTEPDRSDKGNDGVLTVGFGTITFTTDGP